MILTLSKEIIDAEFSVAERRLPSIKWRTVVWCAIWLTAASMIVYAADDAWSRVAAIWACAFWIAMGPVFGLLTKPRLSQEEVEQLASRLRANARPGRAKR